MKLLDLPVELTQDIVNEMVGAVGLYEGVRLRLFCSNYFNLLLKRNLPLTVAVEIFDNMVVGNICNNLESSFKNHWEHVYATISPPFLVKILRNGVERQVKSGKLPDIFTGVVDLVCGSDPVKPARNPLYFTPE